MNNMFSSRKAITTLRRLLAGALCAALLFAECRYYPTAAAGGVTVRTKYSKDITVSGISFSDDLFAQATTTFSTELAQVSAVLASNSRGGYTSYTKNIAETYGFGNFKVYSNTDASLKQGATTFCTAEREILRNGDSTKLVMIQITDTSKAGDTVSNLDFLNKESSSSLNYAANNVLTYSEEADRILSKLQNQLDSATANGRCIIWVVGYCRGGGIGNCLAKALDDRYGTAYVTAYLFGVGNTVKSGQISSTSRYNNIFNTNDTDDIQTYFPLSEWGYGRWGVDVQLGLPSDSSKRQTLTNQLDSAYKTLTASADRSGSIHLPESYECFGSGEYNGTVIKSFLKNSFYSVITSPKDYYEKEITIRKYTDVSEMLFGSPATRKKIPYNFIREVLNLLNQDSISTDTMKDYLLMGAASFNNSCDAQKIIKFAAKYGFDITELSASSIVSLVAEGSFELKELLLHILPENYLTWFTIANPSDGILNYASLPHTNAQDSVTSGSIQLVGSDVFYADQVFTATRRSDVNGIALSLKYADGRLCTTGNQVKVYMPTSLFSGHPDSVYMLNADGEVTTYALTYEDTRCYFETYDVNGTVLFASPLYLSGTASGTGNEITFDQILPSTGGTLESGNYYMAGNTMLSETLEIPAGATVNLCLNGHVLKGPGGTSVITVSAADGDTPAGTLCVYDSETTAHTFSDSSGLWVWDDTLTGSNVKHTVQSGCITGGSGDYGSAINNKGVTVVYGGSIVGNTQNKEHSTIYNTGTFTMYSGSIMGNVSKSGAGGVYNTGSFTAYENVLIAYNKGNYGGGIWTKSGTVTMTGSTIAGNTAGNGGGGIAAGSTVRLTGVTIRDNTASATDGGGGMRIDDGKTVTLTDCSIEGKPPRGTDSVFAATATI